MVKKMNNRCALFVVLVTLFALEGLCSEADFASSDGEDGSFDGGNRSSKVFPIDVNQGGNINPLFVEKITRKEAILFVSQYSRKMPWRIRTLKGRELVGLISGSSTMGVTKIAAGLVLVGTSLNSQSTILAQDEIGQSFAGNVTLSDVYGSMDHHAILISPFEKIDIQNNTTSLIYKAYGVSMQSPNAFSSLGLAAGAYLIASGICDFAGAFHLQPSFNDTFESMVSEAVNKFSDDIMLSEKAFCDYLDYAYGGYIDAYQKRGVFNKNSFMYFLTQYRNWEKVDENA